jgi:branched-subunit amino acid transport protein
LEDGVSAGWVAVLVVGAGTFALKALGPVVVGDRRLPGRVASLLDVAAPAILAALVVTETFAHGRALVLDARLGGLAAGLLAVALRAPIWVAVLAGAVATALVRLIS